MPPAGGGDGGAAAAGVVACLAAANRCLLIVRKVSSRLLSPLGDLRGLEKGEPSAGATRRRISRASLVASDISLQTNQSNHIII